ncbi:MAG: hypothetical protein COA70_06165 [Planctomycetota bacterium]|nr:MAG: hypothetical protein COA70_06165 [Planctomycetota bacterium]
MFLRTILPLLAVAAIVVFLLWNPQAAELTPSNGNNPAVEESLLQAAQLDPASLPPSAPERMDALPSKLPELETGAQILSVQVINGQGHPSPKVPVSIWKVRSGTHSAWLLENTQANGIARFEMPPLEPGKDFTMVVGFAFPCGEARSVKFLRSEIPTSTVLLTLAATGTVEVQLLDEADKPWLFPTEVRCAPTSKVEASNSIPRGYAGPGLVSMTTDKDGRIAFPCVSRESSHTASVFAGNFGEWGQKAFDAPKSNRTIKLNLQLLEANPRATFRILKPDGSPLAQHAWSGWLNQFSIEEGNNWSWPYRMAGRTDSQGYATIAITDSLVGKTWTSRDLVIEAVIEETEPALRARRETLSMKLASSPFLGDLRLEPASIFVGGYIFSTSGLPIEGVKVGTQEESIVSTQVRTESKFTPTPTQTTLHEDGSFQLWGSVRPKVLKLMVSAPGFHAQEVVADVGDTNLEIRLEPSLIVSGQLVGLGKETLEKTRVHYVPPGAKVAGFIRSGKVVTQTPDSEGLFLLSGIESTEDGKVQVFIQNSDAPFLEVEEVSPWAFDADGDSRFHPLLAKEPFVYRVYLKTPEGEIALGAKHHVDFGFGFSGRQGSAFPQIVTEGYFETYAATETLALNFHHKKYRPIHATVKPGDSTLTFQPPLFAKVELSEFPTIPDDIEILFLVESKADRNISRHAGHLGELTPEALQAVPISSAGTYLVSLFLIVNDSWPDKLDVLWPNGEKVLEVEVLDQPDQVFQITFPYVGIQEAIQRLREER